MAAANGSFAVSILSLYEVAVAADAMRLTEDWLGRFRSEMIDTEPMPLQVEGALVFAGLKRRLAAADGASLSALTRHNVDLMIAATAIVEDLTLVSNDSLFQRLAKIDTRLHLEDWTAS